MSELKKVIDQIGDGSLDMGTAIPQIKRLIVTDDPSRPGAELSYEEKVDRQFEDDNDYDNTFSEVVAAWIEGVLSDEEYNEIREAVTPSQK